MSAEAKPMPVVLQIAKDLALPLEAVTQTFAILAKRRAGKSFTARRFTEQLHSAGQQVVIVDPKGDWWGVRSSADGRTPGLPIVILGGERGDVKLEPSAGEVVSKLVVEESISALLDLSLLRKHEVATFMAIFLEGLYRLKAREQYRTPMMLVIDEADAIAPQRPMKGEERMLGAAEDIVRRGGQRGIGCMMVSQRSAVLNKNLLTQAQVLVALRTISPQDLGALDAWIDVHGTQEERKTLMNSLPALPTGDAWFWSPGWPTLTGIFKRVHVLPIQTFDSGATPEPGKKRIEPKHLADIDLEALGRQMAATIERAKAEDPRELRRRIRELEGEARKAQTPAAAPAVDIEQIERRAREQGRLEAFQCLQEAFLELKFAPFNLRSAGDQATKLAAELREYADQVEKVLAVPATKVEFDAHSRSLRPMPPRRKTPITLRHEAAPGTYLGVRLVRAASDDPNLKLPGGERAVLIACAQHSPGGVTREQLSVLTGYKRSSRDAYIQRLREKGYVQAGIRIVATEAGVESLGTNFEPLPLGPELRKYWLARLPEGERAMLEILITQYPRAVARDMLDERTQYKRSSRDAYLQRLKARELVEITGPGEVRASEELF